ncbi:MAG: helix-turn-helix transcriptional regulator [Dehalogenimonas sp.]|uniref:Helix-turn-helix transcriptional regulator n=1 Tax=Candidatus Dehalogenimonas loeffleri TaxID=3127115 RepID=A0ABZ2J668_9CHLR|nr:helix-turn-helix transcriptional regulator [Dehalogenimonas sp.]
MNTDYDKFEAELLNRPGIRKAYEELAPKYALITELIHRRNELKISQRELARRIGTRQPAISRLEAGDNNARLETLIKVAEALGLEFTLTPKESPDNRKTQPSPATREILISKP